MENVVAGGQRGPREVGPERRVDLLHVDRGGRDRRDHLVRAQRGPQAARQVEQATVALRYVGHLAGLDVDAEAVEGQAGGGGHEAVRSEEHTSELQSLMRISYAVFCLNKKKIYTVIN